MSASRAGILALEARRSLGKARKQSRDLRKLAKRGYRQARTQVRPVRRRAEERLEQFEVERRLQAMGRGQGPIVAGPWLGELGYEILYWIPFLRWACERYDIDPSRITAISRGGPRSWYGDLAEHYVDVFELYSPETVKGWHTQAMSGPGPMKQLRVRDHEAELALRAQPAGSPHAAILHPSMMYPLFMPALKGGWTGSRPLAEVLERTVHRPFAPPAGDGPAPALPSDYVAVKAYFNGSFPDTEANRAFVSRLVARLADVTPVVLLSAGVDVDDHGDVATSEAEGRVLSVEHLMTPSTNLEVQTRVLRGARAAFCTYGGFSYAGPFVDVPTFTFHSHPDRLNPIHLEMMLRAGRALQASGHGAGFGYLSVDDAAALDGVLSSVASREWK